MSTADHPPRHPARRDLVADLTVWFEARLDDMMPPRRTLARRYGLEVIDRDGIAVLDPTAVRVVFICEALDVAAVRAVSSADEGFDATAIVEWVWATVPEGASRPEQYARRRRARHVTVRMRGDATVRDSAA